MSELLYALHQDHSLRFRHPEPPVATPGPKIVPIFLPFAGCARRCLYCSQEYQTGQHAGSLEKLYAGAADLLDALPPGQPRELAFFGGTFTALPGEWPERFLDLAQRYRKQARIARVRCSTRPDAVEARQLARLKAMGLDCVELGVQSFEDAALAASQRGYDGARAVGACELVRQAGLELVIQLLPGLPGQSRGGFRADIDRVVTLGPAAVRLYPCLVIEGSGLASRWREGRYRPWSLRTAVPALSLALLRLWPAGVRVIRTGLAPSTGLAGHILAGPAHPALGTMARSLALLVIVRAQLARLGRPARQLRLPRRYQGEIWGHCGALVQRYARLGLTRARLSYWNETFFEFI